MCEAKSKSARKWPASLLLAALVTLLTVPAFAGEEGEIDPILLTSPAPADGTAGGAVALLRSLYEILVEGPAWGLYGWLFSPLF